MTTRERSLVDRFPLFSKLQNGLLFSQSHCTSIGDCTTWNVLKKKETAGVLSYRHRTGQPKKTAVDVRNIVRAVKKNPQNINQWHYKQSPQGRGEGISIIRLKKTESSNIEARLQFEKKYRDEPQRWELEQSFMDWWDLDLPLPKGLKNQSVRIRVCIWIILCLYFALRFPLYLFSSVFCLLYPSVATIVLFSVLPIHLSISPVPS